MSVEQIINLGSDLIETIEQIDDPMERLVAIESLRESLHRLSPQRQMPVDRVRWVPIEKVRANDYNPNSVPKIEMNLLYVSINADGYTQPVVTVYDEEKDVYVIVDGFHRYFTMKANADIYERANGMLPVVVIEKSINERMAATVRHNRARGKHSVEGMSNMVFEMLENGWSDPDICNELGMSPEELIRLKHITGFSKLFKDAQYSKAWRNKNQIRAAKKQLEETGIAPPE